MSNAGRTFPLFLACVLAAPGALADRVQVPLTLDSHFIQMLLEREVFSNADGSLRINDDGTGCQYLALSDAQVRASGGGILLTTRTAARAGRAIGGRCLLALDWRGPLELTQALAVGEDRRSVLLRTTSWRVLAQDGATAQVPTIIGRWLEEFLPMDLKVHRIDLSQPLTELDAFLTQVIDAGGERPSAAPRDPVVIDDIAVVDDGVTVTLGIDVPTTDAAPTRAEPALGAGELEVLTQRLDAVDAFFTYTVRRIGEDPGVAETAPLFETLVGLRRQVLVILADRSRPMDDPVRSLFLTAWDELTPTLRVLAAQQPEADQALHYLTFISAGEALRALDRLGPAAGIEVSDDGLRRLARLLLPDADGDPLLRDDSVDAALRTALGFGAPLPPPETSDDASWLDWFVPPAYAASALDASAVKRLNNWVPATRDMDVYLPMVRDVLGHVVAEQLGANALDPQYHTLFRWLLFAAAWQESCWRQFVAKDDKRVPMQSASGDLGMMQINPTVWRGLYDLQGMRWDIVYNARAGADILQHYLVDYALRHEEYRRDGGIDNLARSAYAAYNGGPRQYDRYRNPNASANGRKVDALFEAKYSAVKAGQELGVTACYSG